jgi:hypothetical protein
MYFLGINVPYEMIFYLIIICFKMNTMMCSVNIRITKHVRIAAFKFLYMLYELRICF